MYVEVSPSSLNSYYLEHEEGKRRAWWVEREGKSKTIIATLLAFEVMGMESATKNRHKCCPRCIPKGILVKSARYGVSARACLVWWPYII